MKKLFVLLVVATACSFTALHAQPQQMTPEERMDQMKEKLKALNVTGVQADSVVAIMMDRSYMQGMNFREMTPEDRQAKRKEIGDARLKRMVKAGIAEDTAKKAMEALSMPAGGRPQGGGGKK